MEKYYCEIEEKELKGVCLFEKNKTVEGNRTCQQCFYYLSTLAPPAQKTQKKKSIKPKSSVSSTKKTKAVIANQKLGDKTRKKYKWEFLRRNKDYIKDYLKQKDEKETPEEVMFKWRFAFDLRNRKLVDSNNSNPDFENELELLNVMDPPRNASMRAWLRNNNGIPVSLLSPGSEVDGKKIEHWTMYHKARKIFDIVDKYNYPQWLCMSIQILPYYPKTKLIKIFIKEFKKQLDILLKLQRSISGINANRTRLNLYDRYLRVYDLHEKEKWTFERIAKKIFPREFRNPLKVEVKSREPDPERAIKKVQYYYRDAKRMIDEGWKLI
jgi:hypothetical protein